MDFHRSGASRLPASLFMLLGLLLLLPLGMPAAAVAVGEQAAVSTARPNVLLLIVDDLNDEVGFMGDASAHTPNMDQLAAQSVVFEHAYAQAPICNPSRTSFLTGMYPHSTGIYGLEPAFWQLPEFTDALTIPLYLRGAGYRTAAIGKVFHQRNHEPSFTDNLKSWFGAFGPFPDTPLNLDSTIQLSKYFDWGPYLTETQTPDYKVSQKATQFLQQAAEQKQPFFLALGFFRPHVPLYAPQEFFDQHPLESIAQAPDQSSDLDDIPAFARKLVSYDAEQRFSRYLQQQDRARSFRQAFKASVSLADRELGRVLDALEASGQADSTIVILTSDHGVQNGEKNLWFKRTLWDKTLHVPMLVRVPGQPPKRVAAPVGLIDIFPTLCELLDLPLPAQLDGVSVASWLQGASGAGAPPRGPVISVHGPGNVSLTDGRWRYIRYADGSEELYDHSVDAQERRNLAWDGRPVTRHAEILDEFRRQTPADFKDFAPGTQGMSSAAYPGK